MSVLGRALSPVVQQQVLDCLDPDGIVRDDEKVVRLLAVHLPEMLLDRWSAQIVDLCYELWQERQAVGKN